MFHPTRHGYQVLNARPSENGGDIIIAHRPDHPVHQYVVWRRYGDNTCEGGGYYATHEEAKADYRRRR